MEMEVLSDAEVHVTLETDPGMGRMSMTESVLEGMNMLDAVLEQASASDMDQIREPDQETVYEVEREENEVPPTEPIRDTVYEVEVELEPASITPALETQSPQADEEPMPTVNNDEAEPTVNPEVDSEPVGMYSVYENSSVPDSVSEDPTTQELGVSEAAVPSTDTQDVSEPRGGRVFSLLLSLSLLAKTPTHLQAWRGALVMAFWA